VYGKENTDVITQTIDNTLASAKNTAKNTEIVNNTLKETNDNLSAIANGVTNDIKNSETYKDVKEVTDIFTKQTKEIGNKVEDLKSQLKNIKKQYTTMIKNNSPLAQSAMYVSQIKNQVNQLKNQLDEAKETLDTLKGMASNVKNLSTALFSGFNKKYKETALEGKNVIDDEVLITAQESVEENRNLRMLEDRFLSMCNENFQLERIIDLITINNTKE